MSASTSFDDFCRIWPMRSEAERVEAETAFAEIPEEDRARTIVASDAWRSISEQCDLPVPPAAIVLREKKGFAFDYLARTEPSVRKLMRGAAWCLPS